MRGDPPKFGGSETSQGRAPENHQDWELSDRCRRCARRGISGERIDEVNAARSKNFTEIKDDWIQKDGGNRGSYADVGYLADAAGSVVTPVGVGVRSDLQEKEKGEQRQRDDDGRGQPAARPGTCWMHCASCKQTLPPQMGRIKRKKVPPHCYPYVDAVQERNG